MMKTRILLVAVLISGLLLTGCSNDGEAEGFNVSKEITVISREEGSGTRGAFVEMIGIVMEDENGNNIDMIKQTADVTQSTGVMLSSVESNLYAIGYISLGSLNDEVKALAVDGAAPTNENINNGTYKVSRPFNIVTNPETSELTRDFIQFILSTEGQKVVADTGYIAINDSDSFVSNMEGGKITISGSSSVTPVMEKLKEKYETINGNAIIEINQSDSTSGVNSVVDGIADIGMVSRGIKENELAEGILPTTIATDGIAVIVNNENEIDNLTTKQIKDIYLGNILIWNELVD